MYMADWISKLDAFLKLSERNVLTHAGKVSHEAAVAGPSSSSIDSPPQNGEPDTGG